MKMVSQSVTDSLTDCRICKSCCSQVKRVKETCCRGTREWHKWQSLKLHYKTDSWQLITLQQNKDFQESRFIVIMNSIIQYKNRSTQSVRGIEREWQKLKSIKTCPFNSSFNLILLRLYWEVAWYKEAMWRQRNWN